MAAFRGWGRPNHHSHDAGVSPYPQTITSKQTTQCLPLSILGGGEHQSLTHRHGGSSKPSNLELNSKRRAATAEGWGPPIVTITLRGFLPPQTMLLKRGRYRRGRSVPSVKVTQNQKIRAHCRRPKRHNHAANNKLSLLFSPATHQPTHQPTSPTSIIPTIDIITPTPEPRNPRNPGTLEPIMVLNLS